jgi:hypothetical protein
VFFEIGLANYLPGVASNRDSTDLCLLVARIAGMSHKRPAGNVLREKNYCNSYSLTEQPVCLLCWTLWIMYLFPSGFDL